MKAIKITGPETASLILDAPFPQDRRPDEVLVKVVAVALNPTDYKHLGFGATNCPTVGCDFAGVVEEVFEGSAFAKGDRVWGMVHGSNVRRPDNAAFQEYVFAREGLTTRIPAHLGFEEAASLPVGVLTVGQGMYQEMELPWPSSAVRGGDKVPILIWGGSSATGALGIQFAKLSGFQVITTAGRSNFEYVRSLGADAVFDSRSPTVGEEIRAYTGDKLCYVWDTIGEYGSEEAGARALASAAPDGQELRYGTILLRDPAGFVARDGKFAPRADEVVYSMSLGYTATGEEFEMAGNQIPARPGDYEFAKGWMPFAAGLVAEGKVRPHRVEVGEGGFEGILRGLEELKSGKVSGKKLVYRVADP